MSTRPRRLVVVFGTATDIGKTWVSCRLLEAARAADLSVAARKPAQSFDPRSAAQLPRLDAENGVQPRQLSGEARGVAAPPGPLPRLDADFGTEVRQWAATVTETAAAGGPGWATDAELLGAATGEAATDVCPAHRWYPLALAPPMAATWLRWPDIAVADLVAEISWPWGVDIGLVETAGGPRSPLAHDGDGLALAGLLRPDLAVLVADAALGTINAVRLAAAAIAPISLAVVLNHFDAADALHAANLAWLRDVDRLDVVTEPAALLDRI